MRHDSIGEGQGMPVPMGKIYKRTDVRVQRFEEAGVGKGEDG